MWPWNPPRGRVTDDGIRVGRRLVPWDDIHHLEWTARGALAATAAGMVRLDSAAAEQVERRIAPWEAVRDEAMAALAPEERAAWFADVDGHRLRVEEAGVEAIGYGCAGLVLGSFALLATWAAVHAAVPAAGFAAVLLALGTLYSVVAMQRSRSPDLHTDAEGLCLLGRTPRRFAWSEVRAVSHLRTAPGAAAQPRGALQRLVILTRRGRITLRGGYLNLEALRAVVQRCVDRREQVAAAKSRGRYAASMLSPESGVWLGEDGLTLVWPRAADRVPWRRVSELEWQEAGPSLRAGTRRLRPNDYFSGTVLARTIDQRLAGGEPLVGPDGALREAVIERWLEVEPGGSLDSRMPTGAVIPPALALLVVVVLAGVMLWHGDWRLGGSVVALVQIIAVVGGLLVATWRTPRTLHADARGLSLRYRRGRREAYAWSEIQALRRMQHGWRIETVRGPVGVVAGTESVERIIGIIRHLLAERDFGTALPNQTPLPETALSRLRGDEPVAQERGLSVAADGDPAKGTRAP